MLQRAFSSRRRKCSVKTWLIPYRRVRGRPPSYLVKPHVPCKEKPWPLLKDKKEKGWCWGFGVGLGLRHGCWILV